MTIKSYRKLLQEAKKSITYKIEKAQLDFIVSINALIRESHLTKKAIAENFGCSAPNITQLLAGDGNYTLETMVKLADAVGGELHIHVARADSRVHWVEALATRNLQPAPSFAKATADTREAWKHCANMN